MGTIKKITFALLALLFIAGTSNAQKNKKDKEVEKDPAKYKKLEEYYSAGKYADCVYKAEKWMEDEKYSKDPEPYMYASMSYLAVFKDPDRFPVKKFEEFKNPLHDALSNFTKFKKHDKTGEAMEENKAFADELKGSAIQTSIEMYGKKDNSHLASLTRDILKAYDKNEVMMLLGGSFMLATNNLADGLKATDSAMVSLKKKAMGTEKPQYSEDEQAALNTGFIAYTDYLITKKDFVKAKDAITIANELLVPNDKLKEQADKIEKASVKK